VGLWLLVDEAETTCVAVALDDDVRDEVFKKLTPGDASWLELSVRLGIEQQLGVCVVDGVANRLVLML
jgi:hypothetical protein